MISWLQISTQDSFLNENSYNLFPAFFFFFFKLVKTHKIVCNKKDM